MRSVFLALAVLGVSFLPAKAALLDFTSGSFVAGLNKVSNSEFTGSISGPDLPDGILDFRLTSQSDSNNIISFQSFDGSTAHCGATLACSTSASDKKDGAGISDDEVREIGMGGQSLTLEFSRQGNATAVWMDDIFFLDLFDNRLNGKGREQAKVQIFEASVLVNTFFFDATATGNGGYFEQAFPVGTFRGDTFVFTADSETFLRDDGTNDYSLAGLSISDVSTVPVPAPILLLVTGLLGLGVLSRRRQKVA